MENRVWRPVRTKCLEQRAKQEMRLVETPLRQKQLSKGLERRGRACTRTGRKKDTGQREVKPKQEREQTVREGKSQARKPKGKRRVIIT